MLQEREKDLGVSRTFGTVLTHYFLYKPAVILGLQYLSKDIKSKAKPSSDSGMGRHLWLSKKKKKKKEEKYFVP